MRNATADDPGGGCRSRHRRRDQRRKDGTHADSTGDLVAKATGKVYPVSVAAAFFKALQITGVY
jgi:hypothetical protein